MPEVENARRARLAERLVERELDAALISDPVNLRYLSGFTGSNGALLVSADGAAAFATDGRYTDQAAAQCPDLPTTTTRALTAGLLDAAGQLGRLGVETHVLTVEAYQEVVGQAGEATTLVSLERAVERLRLVKDEDEIEALRQACAISVAALGELLAGPLEGRTEREVARDLEWRMYALGAEAIAFDTIVASGPNSAVPHHQPTERVLAAGDLLKIDYGARVDGYHADCTRTSVLGAPADWQREIHQAVRDAQWAGVEAMVAGSPVARPDAVAREVLDGAGWLERFTTGIGHGVGLQIHEDPFVSQRNPDTLLAGTPVTMEPGVYLPGRGGVRIEDTVVVREAAPEVLTDTSRELLVVG